MFKALHRARWEVLWEGPLRPLCQTYTIQVLLWREKNHDKSASTRTPQVTVIDPLLRRRSENPSDAIPHHYPNRSNLGATYSVPLRSS